MRVTKKAAFASNSLVRLKNDHWLTRQRIAGKVVADTLSLLQQLIKDKTTQSLIELNSIAEKYIIDNHCSCTFKGFKGFPAGVCISVNNQLVHGIPTDYRLTDGDIVSFDLGATFEGAIADSALTCIYGSPKSDLHVKLIQDTQNALMKGIESIKVGNNIGCIGNAISRYVKNTPFNVIINYGGHGLDYNVPHAPPFIANKADMNEGIHIQPGLSIAIEPMLVIGSTETKVSNDGWTVLTNDIGAHFEHSVFVHLDRIEIITKRNDEV